jgi:hypothetical protein
LYVNEKYTAASIAKKYGVTSHVILKILKKLNCKIRPRKNQFSKYNKEKMIRLYTVEHRGKEYIANLYGISNPTLTRFFNEWGVFTIDRKTISKRIREIYGPTKGFGGRHHSDKSKKQIGKSVSDAIADGNKNIGMCKSQYFNTKYGKLQGSFEVAYIQQLLNEKKALPVAHPRGIKTPIGTYFPDFEYSDVCIEIKSIFTYDVSAGIFKNRNGKFNDTQLKKIEWVKTNVKDVRIIIMDNNVAWQLFKQAVSQDWILDKVEIKHNQYKIIHNALLLN